MDRIPDCTGVIVAGGRARRLGGAPKGLLRLGGETLAARSVGLLGGLFGEVIVASAAAEPWRSLGATVVPDVVPDRGAPGGLHAALAAARTGWIFAAGCDMPFLAEAPIRFLASRRGDAPAVLVDWDRGLEGLHGFWSRRALPVIARMVAEGEPSLRALARAVGAAVVPAEDWRAVDPAGRSFENANTPDDVLRLGLESG